MPENKSICAECAATHGDAICCHRYPGIASPADFQRNGRSLEDALYAALVSGRWCIDWWYDDPVDYFIRPAVKGMEGELKDPTWGGACTFLTDTGCIFEYENRPENCRALIPHPGGPSECKLEGGWEKDGKRYGADLWLPHRKLITDLIEQITKEHEDAEEEEEENRIR